MGSILVVNAGSTSLKLHLVAENEAAQPLGALEDAYAVRIDAVAHRIVHGGLRFREPVVLDDIVSNEIRELEPLAPLHNAPALAAIERTQRNLPDVTHVAVFDTAFHATIPERAALYAVPERWREEWGVRRYGFHGLSVAWSAERVPGMLGRSPEGLRVVVCHLGGGCSVTAVKDGRSFDTTMGFSPVDGVPMTTRSGSVDPEVLLYLLRHRGLDLDSVDHALNLESGLLALSGLRGMLEIEQALSRGDPRAELALAVFSYRIATAVGAMAVAAGGLDALVFTAGIGEGSALVRRRIAEHLAPLGVEVDPGRNEGAEPDTDIAASSSAVRVLVIRAHEEIVTARAARSLLAQAV